MPAILARSAAPASVKRRIDPAGEIIVILPPARCDKVEEDRTGHGMTMRATKVCPSPRLAADVPNSKEGFVDVVLGSNSRGCVAAVISIFP